MNIRYFLDPDTGLPHIYGHGIVEHEIEEVMRGDGDDVSGRENSRIKIGQTSGGRFLKLIYVPDDDGDGIFIITAYQLKDKAKKAYRRRRRGRGK